MAKRRDNQATVNLERDIEQLFRQPLSGFVASRNALVRRLQAADRADEAAQLRTLGRPTAAAWALNQLYWNQRPLFDRLLAAGDRLRTAQQAAVRGRSGASDLREAMQDRQEAVNAATERAAALLRESGDPVTAATRQRMATTAEALASYGRTLATPHAGRLVKDLQPPGFEALASLTFPEDAAATSAPMPRGHVIQMPARGRPAAPSRGRAKEADAEAEHRRKREREAERRRALARARAELAKLERETNKRWTALERTTATEKAAEETLSRAQADADEAAHRLKQAEERATKASRILADAQAARAEAESAVADADRALEQARAALDEIE
jgi:hypothetical protein